ncbi:MAG: hypothetical protein MJZ28_12650 [Paludibacteraceae bacterium]|nr:hypothetical protein [Paludibacteraceae bacterium]
MKSSRLFPIVSFWLALSACSTPASRGRSAGEEYCECSKEESIFSISKCKKDILKEHKEDLLDEEFRNAFWDEVAQYDD